MKPAQFSLFDAPATLGDDVRTQLRRIGQEMLVWLDGLLSAGYSIAVLDDEDAERARLAAVPSAHLRRHAVERFRGTRRAWLRPPHNDRESARAYTYNTGNGERWLFIGYEPQLEAPLFGKRDRAQSDRERHWPKGRA
jgi:hypothetical protein